MRVSVKGDIKASLKHLKGISPRVVRPASVTALNRTVKPAHTQAVRTTGKIEELPAKVVRDRVRFYKATRRKASASIVGLTLPLPVAKAGTPRQLKKKGARAGKHLVPGGFVADMEGGHVGIYKRKGKARLPIQEQYIHIGSTIRAELAGAAIGAPREFVKRFEHEAKRLAKREARRHQRGRR
ncbi:MAG: phage tail protein [Pseudomonadota bacterium]